MKSILCLTLGVLCVALVSGTHHRPKKSSRHKKSSRGHKKSRSRSSTSRRAFRKIRMRRRFKESHFLEKDKEDAHSAAVEHTGGTYDGGYKGLECK